jgi:hypothetical protein
VQVESSAATLGIIAGTTATMQLGGFYGVSSADSGQLSMVITDQNNTVISTSTKTVPHGGDSFAMSSTFTVPLGTKQACRQMVLEIGTAILTAIPSADLQPCIAVLGG